MRDVIPNSGLLLTSTWGFFLICSKYYGQKLKKFKNFLKKNFKIWLCDKSSFVVLALRLGLLKANSIIKK